MRKIVLLIVVIISLIDCVHGQVASDCAVPQLLRTDYERDIKNLALRRMYQFQSPDTALISIQQSWQDTIAEGLAAIFNAPSIPERDSIFNMYCVHDNTVGNYEVLQSFLLQVDTTHDWTQAWQELNPLSGNPYIDSLVTAHDLSIGQFFNWPSGSYALLHTDSLLNSYALVYSLEQEPGIIDGEPELVIGPVGKIVYDKIGDTRYYDFYFEFNDCFDGCDNYRMWQFAVDSDCSVTYLGYTDWGFNGILPLPPPLNCNTFVTGVEEPSIQGSYQIYPNPFTEIVTIDAGVHELGVTFVIRDQSGRQVMTGKLSYGPTLVDVGHIASGVYVVEVGQERKQTFKLIKK